MPEPVKSARARRRLLSVALAVVSIVALSACAGIPESGRVFAGGEINDEAEPILGFAPQGPRVDSTQEEILSDFIAAATNPGNDYQIAREFLAKGFAEEWDPDAITTIRSGVGTSRRVSETELGYSLSTSASVDKDGRYTEQDPASATLPFTFVKEGKQWRISSAPPGVVLSQNNFPQVFGEYPLYFFDPSGQYLVPDVRWFPTRSGTSNLAVSSLLAGQSPWLGNGVLVSAFPAGTKLGDGLVEITSGAATVDLSDEARATTAAERARMRQQLSTTLAVSTIVMTVGGIPLETPDTAGATAIANPAVEPAPLVLSDGQFGFAAVDDISPVNQISAKIVALGATAVTLARGKTAAAALNPAVGVFAVRSGASAPLLVDARAALVAPSIDNSGFIWSVPGTNAAGIRAFELDGTAHDVTSTLPADASVISIAVSRDGARLLAYLMTSVGPRLVVAGILRQDGVPVALGETLFSLQVGKATPIGATWVDNRTVATLAANGDNTVITSFEIGGPSGTLGQVESGTTIVGGNGGSDGLRVLTVDGRILRPRGTSWQATDVTATVLATQQ